MIGKAVFLLIALVTPLPAGAANLSDASNYQRYSDHLSSSGQPSVAQLEDAARQGFERVIYLAFTDSSTAIEDEDRVVKQLGMDYVHIPVEFKQPALDDFKAFVRALDGMESSKTLVHCQINLRASSFIFLHRVVIDGVPVLEAKEDLDSVWEPTEVWFRFIRTVLENYELSPACDECDWGANEFIDE